MRLDHTTLTVICESIASRGSLAAAARAAAISESTLFKWIVDSKRASERHDTSSPHYFEWQGISDYFAPGHIKRAKSVACLSMLHLVLDQTRNGIEEVVFSPVDNRPVVALNPEYIGRSDSWMLDHFLDPDRDRLLFNDDGTPVYQTRVTQIPASLRQKVITGMIPSVFSERSEVDVRLAGQVIHKVEPATYVPRAQRVSAEPGDVVDAKFTEVGGKPALPSPPLRPDIAQLREMAAALERDPNRITRPQGVVRQADGRPVGAMRPDDPPDDAGPPVRPESTHPTQPKPQPAQRRDGYPAGSDPRAPGARASRIG